MMATPSGRAAVDVCIRGAGAVGLTLALALSRQGLAVAVAGQPTARRGDGRPDVRAYALNADSRALLMDLKVWSALPADAVTPVEDMRIEGDDVTGRLGFSAWQQGAEALAWIVDAGELDQALATAAGFAPHLVLIDADAPEPHAALRVLAEGKHSSGRAALGVRFERQPYGHTALAARLQSDLPHLGLARQWFRSPDVLALLPLDRPAAGHSHGLVWSMPQERAQALLEAPPAEFEAALAEATGGVAGQLQVKGERVGWPLAIGRADTVCGPGWVLVGDAAHQVHPLAGQGLNLGLADVASLARVLAGREGWRALGDERLLRRYARDRAAPNAAMAALTDGLLHLFEPRHAALRELRNRGMGLLDRLPPLKRLLAGQAMGAGLTGLSRAGAAPALAGPGQPGRPARQGTSGSTGPSGHRPR